MSHTHEHEHGELTDANREAWECVSPLLDTFTLSLNKAKGTDQGEENSINMHTFPLTSVQPFIL